MIRSLYPYGSERRILFGPLRSWRYIVERGHGFSYALGMGSYNVDFLIWQVREGMVVYDIGANRGQVALFFSRRVGPSGLVHAFEPAPIPFQSLHWNITLNNLSNAHAWQLVVSNANGEEPFTFFENHPTEGRPSRLVSNDMAASGKTFRVPSVTLDSFVRRGERRPEVLKIDVEGSAAAVLEGARNTMETAKPGIYIELHNAEAQKAVRDELQSRGYQLQTMNGRKVADPTDGWSSPLWCWLKK